MERHALDPTVRCCPLPASQTPLPTRTMLHMLRTESKPQRKSRRLWSDERGNTLAVVALVFPLLVGSAGLAVDMVQWTVAKNALQKAADQAAIAGVNALVQGASLDAAVSDAVALNKGLDRSTSTQVTQSPEDRRDDPFAVQVQVSAPAAMTFSSLFLSKPFSLSVKATASVVESGDYCLLAFGAGQDTGITIAPAGELEADCGLASNSSSPAAILVSEGGRLSTPRIVAFGGITGLKDGSAPVARSYGLKQKDPYAHTEAPPVPNTGCPTITVNPDTKVRGGLSLKPGCYGNMVLNGNVTLRPGEYILNRGNLIVGPMGNVSCKGCTIILTSEEAGTDPGSIGKVQIDPKGTVKLSAPVNGADPGLLIYQDPRAGREVMGQESRIGGSGFSKLDGIIYMPSQAIRIDGRGGADLRCSRLMGRALIIEGRVVIGKDCLGIDRMKIAGTEVRLVD